jgi:uncharacterized membrane protein YeiB
MIKIPIKSKFVFLFSFFFGSSFLKIQQRKKKVAVFNLA